MRKKKRKKQRPRRKQRNLQRRGNLNLILISKMDTKTDTSKLTNMMAQSIPRMAKESMLMMVAKSVV